MAQVSGRKEAALTLPFASASSSASMRIMGDAVASSTTRQTTVCSARGPRSGGGRLSNGGSGSSSSSSSSSNGGWFGLFRPVPRSSGIGSGGGSGNLVSCWLLVPL